MGSKTGVVLGSILGAAAINIAFFACGGGDGGTAAGSGGGSFVDQVLDAVATVMDGSTKDAKAADPTSCTCAGTMKTADTDLAQLIRIDVPNGMAGIPKVTALTDGPLVVTSMNSLTSGTLWTVPKGTTCAFPNPGNPNGPLVAFTQAGTQASPTGQYFPVFVKAGETLCGQSTHFGDYSGMVLSGYRPYP